LDIEQNKTFLILFDRIRLLNKPNFIIGNGRHKPTEQDFVDEVWTPIMTAIFDHPEIYLKW
jgi:hypothetical protein